MGKYKNEDNLKKEIMEQSRHLFVYGYDSDYRTNFLQELEKDYPIVPDSNKPIALYLDSFGLPNIDINIDEKKEYLIEAMSREYLHFVIVTKLLERTLEIDMVDFDDKLSKFFNLINRYLIDGYPSIKNIDDLLRELKLSRDFYYNNYVNYARGLIDRIPIDDISIPFIQLESFISQYKSAMNMDSYFGIILDKKSTLAVSSVQSINSLIGSRINKDLSIKVAVEPDKWETYRGVNRQMVETVHDYGNVELDDSYQAFTRKLLK